jgi:hypothetical protein
MGVIDDLKNCKSCAERREKMKQYFGKVQDWARHPFGAPPFPEDLPPMTVVRKPFTEVRPTQNVDKPK